MTTVTSTPNILFGTTFNTHEIIEVLPLEEIGGSVMIVQMQIVFSKDPFFKGKIINTNTTEYSHYWIVWTQQVKARKLNYPTDYIFESKLKDH